MKNPSCFTISQIFKVFAIVAMFVSLTVQAEDDKHFKIFGNVHISIDDQDSVGNTEMHSNTSTFGIQGGKKLKDKDLEVIFKLEWQYDADQRQSVVDRDQWVGLKGNFGKVLIGTATSNYKQTSSQIDPLWRTQLEGRSAFMRTASRQLSAGAGDDRGRLTNSVNYTTPNYNGFEVVINRTFSGVANETTGVGVRHKTKVSLIFVDYFEDGDVLGVSQAATKVGGYYKFAEWTISAQVESSEDIDGSNYSMLAVSYQVSDSDTLKFSFGEADGLLQSSSAAILYDWKLASDLNVYAGYGSKSDDLAADDDILTFGIRYLF